MDKKEAVQLFVERNFAGIPQEWVQIIAEKKQEEIYAWPMWGTMWIVDDWIGKKLMDHAVMVCEPSECENHDKDTTCDTCEEWEEMGGAYNIKDKNGISTRAYIYDIDDVYVLGIHGAGWNFYDGLWDALYDLLNFHWHDKEDKNKKDK